MNVKTRTEGDALYIDLVDTDGLIFCNLVASKADDGTPYVEILGAIPNVGIKNADEEMIIEAE